MKHISLLALVMAFSVNSSAKSILCASKDHSIVVSVSTEDQVNSQGYLQANSLMIHQYVYLKSILINTKEVVGGIDVETGSAHFLSRAKGLDAGDISGFSLSIDDYKEGKNVVLNGIFKIVTKVDGEFMREESQDMNCITHLEVGI